MTYCMNTNLDKSIPQNFECYSIYTYPDEEISELRLMCCKYVGIKNASYEFNLGIDCCNVWENTLKTKNNF